MAISANDSSEKDSNTIGIMFLALSLFPIFLIFRVIWIFLLWIVSLFWLLRNRTHVKGTLRSIFGLRTRQGTVVLVIISIISSFVIVHASMYAGDLHWGVEVGDEFSYTILTPVSYYSDNSFINLNLTTVVFEITSLPSIPLYCDRGMFVDLVVDYSKASVSFDNGSSLESSHERELISLFSNSILPIGNWAFIDGLCYDRARGGFGAPVQDPWFSRFDGSDFVFGESHISCTGAPGWNARISLDDGVPLVINKDPYVWGGPLIVLTRVI